MTVKIEIHKAYDGNGVTIEAASPFPDGSHPDIYRADGLDLANALEMLPSGTIDCALDILLWRIGEAEQSRLDDINARLQEMDCALVAGNLSHDDIPFDTLKQWMHYVITGRSNSPNEDDFLSVAELDADSAGHPGGFCEP